MVNTVRSVDTIRVEWDDISGGEHLDIERVVSEVETDLQHSELRICDALLLGQPVLVVVSHQLLRPKPAQP